MPRVQRDKEAPQKKKETIGFRCSHRLLVLPVDGQLSGCKMGKKYTLHPAHLLQ